MMAWRRTGPAPLPGFRRSQRSRCWRSRTRCRPRRRLIPGERMRSAERRKPRPRTKSSVWWIGSSSRLVSRVRLERSGLRLRRRVSRQCGPPPCSASRAFRRTPDAAASRQSSSAAVPRPPPCRPPAAGAAPPWSPATPRPSPSRTALSLARLPQLGVVSDEKSRILAPRPTRCASETGGFRVRGLPEPRVVPTYPLD